MKQLILTAILMASSQVMAARRDTGNFEISKTNFKDLFNNYRYSQPKIVPWSGNFFAYGDFGTDVKLGKEGMMALTGGTSPMDAYAGLPSGNNKSVSWERQHHSCEGYDEETAKGCKEWWGHCNGWAAAAIKEMEPRHPIRLKNRMLSVADQKGILSELWLASYSLNAGITDKEKKTDTWVSNHQKPNAAYRNFWDVTPKAFFLIFTNYVGILKTGVVIDRFTGDEVWNQPVVGYRFLPINKDDITTVKEGRHTYHQVKLRVKIYWANDLDVPYNHVSAPFDIRRMNDSETVDTLTKDYEGRFLALRLNFDGEVKVSSDGKQIVEAGDLVGEGVWEHQLNSARMTPDDLNQTHPDFIWIPTEAYVDDSGYGNPYVDSEVVETMASGRPVIPKDKRPITLQLSFPATAFDNGDPALIKRRIQYVIRREAIRNVIDVKSIKADRSSVKVVIEFPDGVSQPTLMKLFELSKMDVKLDKAR